MFGLELVSGRHEIIRQELDDLETRRAVIETIKKTTQPLNTKQLFASIDGLKYLQRRMRRVLDGGSFEGIKLQHVETVFRSIRHTSAWLSSDELTCVLGMLAHVQHIFGTHIREGDAPISDALLHEHVQLQNLVL